MANGQKRLVKVDIFQAQSLRSLEEWVNLAIDEAARSGRTCDTDVTVAFDQHNNIWTTIVVKVYEHS